ncbi:HAD family phosphatase [uncultured Weeksella sp.]|uniref:HAD family hydrolase n=1 Tax=uncultured Weeksella sp. TaxID=1161389 RepID=UPI00259BD4AD|nr:HAD family phosphatase [uncultured Weeksella sp.]
MGKKINAIFFDFDGVIVDSLQLWEQMFDEVVKLYHLDTKCLVENDGMNFTTNEAIQLMLENQQRFTNALSAEIIEWTEKFYIDNFHQLLRLNEHVVEVLEHLKANQIQIILVSNSSKRQVKYAFEQLKLHSYFDHTISADDVSKGKPNAEPYLKALSLSEKQKEEVLVIEDSLTGINSAKVAGLNYKIYNNSAFCLHPNYIADFRELIKEI